MMLALALLQKPPVRDLSPGLERKYRVTVDREDDRTTYRLRTRVDSSKKDGLRLDVRLTDYRATVGERTVTARKLGGGLMPLAPNGLPGGLSIAGPQGPIWLPLLSFYLPASETFELSKLGLGEGLSMSGKGTYKESRIEIAAAISREEKELAKLTLSTTLDPKGWPLKAEGTFVGADGTYRFTLEKG